MVWNRSGNTWTYSPLARISVIGSIACLVNVMLVRRTSPRNGELLCDRSEEVWVPRGNLPYDYHYVWLQLFKFNFVNHNLSFKFNIIQLEYWLDQLVYKPSVYRGESCFFFWIMSISVWRLRQGWVSCLCHHSHVCGAVGELDKDFQCHHDMVIIHGNYWQFAFSVHLLTFYLSFTFYYSLPSWTALIYWNS